MNAKGRFEEVKIRMVMKLKKLTHRAAVAEIARMNAAKRKAAEEETTRAAADKARVEECRAALRRRHGQSANISRGNSDGFLPVEDLFGKI